MKLGLGTKDFERDFRRGIVMLFAFCMAVLAGFLLVGVPVLLIVELAGGRFDNWIWLPFLSGAIYGVRVLGLSAEITSEMG